MTSQRIQPVNSKVDADDSYTEMASRAGEGEGEGKSEDGEEGDVSAEGAALDDFMAAVGQGGSSELVFSVVRPIHALTTGAGETFVDIVNSFGRRCEHAASLTGCILPLISHHSPVPFIRFYLLIEHVCFNLLGFADPMALVILMATPTQLLTASTPHDRSPPPHCPCNLKRGLRKSPGLVTRRRRTRRSQRWQR